MAEIGMIDDRILINFFFYSFIFITIFSKTRLLATSSNVTTNISKMIFVSLSKRLREDYTTHVASQPPELFKKVRVISPEQEAHNFCSTIMSEPQNSRHPNTLQKICIALVKETIPLTLEQLFGLNEQVVGELALFLPPAQLLGLEENFRTGVTEAAWKKQCLKCGFGLKDEKFKCLSHPASVVRSYRDLWLKSYLSKHLLYDLEVLYRFTTCSKSHPSSEIQASRSLFFARDSDKINQLPPWTFTDFIHHLVIVARLVKEFSARASTLQRLFTYPEVIQALQTNLVSLTVDLLKDKNVKEFLKIVEQLMSKGQLKYLKLLNTELSSLNWDLLFFVCSGQFHCMSCAQCFAAGMKDTADAMAHSLDFNCGSNLTMGPCNSLKPSAPVTDTAYLCSQLSSHTVDTLNKIGYPGLADYNFQERNACSGTGSDDECIMSKKDDGCVPMKKRRTSNTDTAVHEFQFVVGEDREVEFCTAVDLMDEALSKVSAGIDRNSSDTGSPCLNNYREGQSVDEQDSAFCRLKVELTQHDMDIKHRSAGVQALILHRWKADTLTAHVVPALISSLTGWSSLSILHLTLQPFIYFDDFSKVLVDKVRQGSLKNLRLDFSVPKEIRVQPEKLEYESSDTDSSFVVPFEQFFWELLQVLSSRNTDHQALTDPMQYLHVDLPLHLMLTTVPVNFSADKTFSGLQRLELRWITFGSVAVLSPLTCFIEQDCALCHLSLFGCGLDAASADLLLAALCKKAVNSLEYLNLGWSLKELTESHWKALCQLLNKHSSLAFLSLEQCGVTSDQVIGEEFISAIKKHKSSRSLTLNLSYNFGIEEGLLEFMLAVICPNSSLKDLRIAGLTVKEQQSVRIRDNILNCLDGHLPLLHNIEISIAPTFSNDDPLPILHQIAKCVNVSDRNCTWINVYPRCN